MYLVCAVKLWHNRKNIICGAAAVSAEEKECTDAET